MILTSVENINTVETVSRSVLRQETGRGHVLETVVEFLTSFLDIENGMERTSCLMKEWRL